MIGWFNKKLLPIGIDYGSRYIKMIQLGKGSKGLFLHEAAIEQVPEDIKLGSADWQRWAIKQTKRMFSEKSFSGRGVMAAMPSDKVFIEQISIAKTAAADVESVASKRVENKLPFNPSTAMIKTIVTGKSSCNTKTNVLVLAVDRVGVDYHLAVYERAGLDLKSMTVWPEAMVNCYVRFFGRRQEDVGTVVLLIDIGMYHTNIVICKHKDLYFARMIPIGFAQMSEESLGEKFVSEIYTCCQYFETSTADSSIQRIVLLSGDNIEQNITSKVSDLARKMLVPAQVGDIVAAIKINSGQHTKIDRRAKPADWTMAFGLSLAGIHN